MKQGGWKILIWVVAALRVVFPVIIFTNPFWALLINLFLDAPDGFISYKAGWRWRKYHVYDKIADWWWYLFIAIFSYSLPVFPLILGLFLVRTVAQVYSAITKNEKILLYVPNALEYYFLFYLLLTRIFGISIDLMSWVNLILVLVAAIVAISQEYRIHVKQSYLANSVFGCGINWEDNEPTD